MILWSFVYKFSFELTFSFLLGVYATAEPLGSLGSFGAFLGAQIVKNLPVLQETQVQSLGREDTLWKEVATRSNILAGELRGQKSLAGCSPWGHKEPDTPEQLTLSLCLGQRCLTF